jgi:hypothetical protein
MAGAANKNERVQFKDISAGTLIKSGKGRFYGWYVNSTTSGTLKIYDNTVASGTVMHNTITPAIGNYMFNNGVDFETGLYVDVPSGTIDVTVWYA